jgi:uncharacterized peroxidase-related enzyme
MPRIQPVNPEIAVGRTKELLDGISVKLGTVPNLMKTFAQSPAALQFFFAGSQALSGSVIPAKVREQIDLVVSQANGCDYCLAAHTQLAKGFRLTDDQIADARRGRLDDPKTAAILEFATALVEHRGRLTDDHFAAARSAGLTDVELADVVAAVALKVFTNYFAIAAQVDVDFPPAPVIRA